MPALGDNTAEFLSFSRLGRVKEKWTTDTGSITKFVVAVCVVLVVFNVAKGGISAGLRSSHKGSSEVKFVAVVHRHGARSGLWKFSFEQDTVQWTTRLGALTPKGMEQAFFLGRKLRKIYWPDLSDGTSPPSDPISSFSTHIDRTVDTAHGVLLGLFSDDGRPLLLQFEECKGWLEEVVELEQSSEIQSAPEKLFKEQLKMVEDVVGGNEVCLVSEVDGIVVRERIDPPECLPIDLRAMEKVWNNAVCAEVEGLEYPSDQKYHTEFIPELAKVATWRWHQMYSVDRGPLAAGMLLDEIMERMEGHLPDASTETEAQDFMVLYSAHDSSVAALLSVLGIVNWHFPDFVSRVALELRAHRDDDVNLFYVNLNYDGTPMEIPGCGMDCSWNDFVALLGPRRQKIETCVEIGKS